MFINIGANNGNEKLLTNKKKHWDCQFLSPYQVRNRIRVTFSNF